MSDTDFLRGMYAAGAADYFDVLGVNAPGYKAPPDLDPEIAATARTKTACIPTVGIAFSHFAMEDLRRIMLEYGDGATQNGNYGDGLDNRHAP